MAAEKAGLSEQRHKAIELSLHIGDEIRRIIIAKEMCPLNDDVGPDFRYYDFVVSKLHAHFKSLTDETVDVAVFNSLKQGEKESALDFEMRLVMVAKRMNETNEAMIRTRFIEGLRDKELRDRAFVDGIPLKQVVMMATRKEAILKKQKQEFVPWPSENRQALSVAAVAQDEAPPRERPGSKSNDWKRTGGDGRYQREREYKQKSNAGSRFEKEKSQRGGTKCKDCGVAQHREGRCPAIGAECFRCFEIGHFRRMCVKRIRSIEYGKEPDEREESHIVSCSIGYGRPLRLLVDPGAEANVISEED